MMKTTLCYIEHNDKYLMLLRGKKPDDPNAGKWLGIGGKFLEGETPDQCMLREVREETGIRLKDFQFHGIIRFRSDTWDDEDMYLYSAKAPDGEHAGSEVAHTGPSEAGAPRIGAEIPLCGEGELCWIEKDKIMDLNLWEGDRLFLERLLRGDEKIEMTLKYAGEKLITAEMPPAGCLLGIDIGGTGIKIGLFTDSGSPALITKTMIPTRTERDGAEILPDTAKAISAICEEQAISLRDIRGAGIGVPGPVMRDKAGSYIANRCVNLNWGVKKVDDAFRSLTGIRDICVLNDANAAALGELRAAGTEEDSAVFITVGTGIGSGIIIDGKILTGTKGSAGEIGHMPVSPDHRLIRSANEAGAGIKTAADLEYYVSAPGICRIAQAAWAGGSNTGAGMGDASGWTGSAKGIFDAAEAGDTRALEVTDLFFEILGKALAAVAVTVDPSYFIIGGGVSQAGAFMIDGLERVYKREAFHSVRNTEIRLAQLGSDAGMYGAAFSLITGR